MDPAEPKPHSAEYFGQTRDYWWNLDFLELMVRRWNAHTARRVLDVGCGMGHWGQLLCEVLSPQVRLTGVDREPTWVDAARARAADRGLGDRSDYVQGTAEALPFADGEFDVVTCQTLLIHVANPKAVLQEMLRVLTPNGLLALVEPNNVAQSLLLDSALTEVPVDWLEDVVRLKLTCERGKRALGLGDNSLGDLLPGWLVEMGLSKVEVYLSDKTNAIHPPYELAEQAAFRAEMKTQAERDFWCWPRQEASRYFIAGGGKATEFERLWRRAKELDGVTLRQLDDGRYHSAGGSIAYLVSARKPG